MADLSPQAQSVDQAAFQAWVTKDDPQKIAAAALRAATLNVFYEETLGMTAYGGYSQALEKILAIATELESQ